MLVKMGIDSFVQTRLTLSRSKMLSSDVSAGVDPLFVSVNDKKNAAYLGNGIVFNKYTGAEEVRVEVMMHLLNMLREFVL